MKIITEKTFLIPSRFLECFKKNKVPTKIQHLKYWTCLSQKKQNIQSQPICKRMTEKAGLTLSIIITYSSYAPKIHSQQGNSFIYSVVPFTNTVIPFLGIFTR